MNVDYKLFTDILMQRLTTALGEVIGSQQSAFLSKRLIDDNIRTVQYLIAKHGTSARPDRRQPGLAIVFLDQEKAYDRVSHEFLFAVLARFGVPEEYISWVRLLYQNAKIKVFVNGYTGEVLWVRFGVRQGDPLSCVLFVAVIEGLARYIALNPDTPGVQVGNGLLKTTMYADDTTVIVRTQAEADPLMAFLEVYCKATGAKLNWFKSYILHVGEVVRIRFREAEEVSADNPYKHLGISVDINIEHQLDEFWAVILAKAKASIRAWARYHLSLKGRVMIVNIFMMSLPRYALRFLNMSIKIKDELNKEYYRLIWNNKIRGIVRDLHSCYPIKKKGMRVIDVHAAIDASVIVMMNRAISNSKSMWTMLARDVFIVNVKEKGPSLVHTRAFSNS